ncbi:hypothetical protein C7S13_6208 [Burkholderia cepacia]|nr:hypothetical protein [Burkholderia cepacia]
MQRRRFYLLAGRMDRVARHAGHPADVSRCRPLRDGRSNRRKFKLVLRP